VDKLWISYPQAVDKLWISYPQAVDNLWITDVQKPAVKRVLV